MAHGYNKLFGGGRLPGTATMVREHGAAQRLAAGPHGLHDRAGRRSVVRPRPAHAPRGRRPHRPHDGHDPRRPSLQRLLRVPQGRGCGVRVGARGRGLPRSPRSARGPHRWTTPSGGTSATAGPASRSRSASASARRCCRLPCSGGTPARSRAHERAETESGFRWSAGAIGLLVAVILIAIDVGLHPVAVVEDRRPAHDLEGQELRRDRRAALRRNADEDRRPAQGVHRRVTRGSSRRAHEGGRDGGRPS